MNSIKSSTVSIVLCTFNGENYISEQLDSILAQTVLPLEIVVGDDASSDRTIEILNEYKKNSPVTIHIKAHHRNLGVIANFEETARECVGDLVFFCDQDDVWLPEKIERFIEAFESNPKCGYVFSDALMVYEDLSRSPIRLWKGIGFFGERKMKYIKGDQLEILTDGRGNFVYGMALAYRRCHSKLIYPVKSTSFAMTHDTWIAFVLSGLGFNGVAINDVLVKYRQHSRQVAGGSRKRNWLNKILYLFGRNRELDIGYIETLRLLRVRVFSEMEKQNCALKDEFQNLSLLDRRIKYLEMRNAATSGNFFERIFWIFFGVFNGIYFWYGNPLASILKDVFFSGKISERMISWRKRIERG